MTRIKRDEVLEKIIPSRKARRPAETDRQDGDVDFGWDELSLVISGLALAQRPISAAARQVTRRFGLAPRGAFILNLISGGVTYPLELASALKVGRSLITAELGKLTEAGLITATPDRDDKRRSELALTPAGAAACEEVRGSMQRILTRNLRHYSREQILLFGAMLRDSRQLEGDESED